MFPTGQQNVGVQFDKILSVASSKLKYKISNNTAWICGSLQFVYVMSF